MRTLILSDTHLGNGGVYDIFAGGEALPALLDRFAEPPTRVILNGDGVDFLLNEDPLELDEERAVAQAEAIAGAPASWPVFEALGRILAAGGEVILRLGNHDVELALGEVREVFRGVLGQPPEVARRLQFERGGAPRLMDVGGVRVLITHGEQNDPFNQVAWNALPGPGAPAGASPGGFGYPPGSWLVKKLLNPLKRRYRMRFADLLKPDVEGAVLTALAVDPGAARLVFHEGGFDFASQVLANVGEVSFAPSSPDLRARIESIGLSPEEREEIAELLRSEEVAFGPVADLLTSARLKLARAGLALYASMQRHVAGEAGEQHFSFTPGAGEMAEARRLATKYGARAVVMGHRHAARWQGNVDLTYANTGTWIWLMRLPDSEAGDEEWTRFLEELRRDPALEREAAARLEQRFTLVTLEPDPEGARMALRLLEPSGRLATLASAVIPATPRVSTAPEPTDSLPPTLRS